MMASGNTDDLNINNKSSLKINSTGKQNDQSKTFAAFLPRLNSFGWIMPIQ